MKETLGRRRHHERADALRTGRLTKNSHVIGITTHGEYVISDPSQCSDLIHQSVVSRGARLGRLAQPWVREKTKGAQSIIYRYDDHSLLSQRRAIKNERMSLPTSVRTAVKPHHDRQGFCVVRDPHIEIKAVLGNRETLPSPNKI